MTPGPIDDERLHRGDSNLVDVEAEPPEAPAPEVAPPPVTNSGLAARAEVVRAGRSQRTGRGREGEEEAEPEVGPREFIGDLPPLPPPPDAPREMTTADEPDDPAAPPAEPPADAGGADPDEPGDPWSQPA